MKDPKDFVFSFGKFFKNSEWKGKTLDELPILELDGYRGYLEGLDNPSQQAREAMEMLNRYFDDPSVQAELDSVLRESGEDD